MKITVVPDGPSAGIYFETEAQLREFLRNPRVETIEDKGFPKEIRHANGLTLRVGIPAPLPASRVITIR